LLKVDPSVVRGLSYYTGTVWEVFASSGNFQRAIAGGGRYDRLLEALGGKSASMVGFGFGDVAIMEVLADLKRMPRLTEPLDDVVYPLGAEQFEIANRIATAQRSLGRRVLVDYSERRFKHVIKMAEQRGAARLLIIGSDEAAEGICTVRTLGEQREENRVAIAELTSNWVIV